MPEELFKLKREPRGPRVGKGQLACALCLLLSIVAASVGEAAADPLCAQATFPDATDVHLATIGTKTAMRRGDGDCSEDPSACRENLDLAAADQVVTSYRKDGWVCAARLSGETVSVGWLRAGDVRVEAEATSAKRADWVGAWVLAGGNGEILLDRRGSRLAIKARMTLDMSIPGDEGDVRAGGFDGAFTPRAGWSEAIGSCKVRLLRLGPYLIADGKTSGGKGIDCGGDGISFNGIYRRQTSG